MSAVGQAGAFEGLVARGKPLVGRSADAAARDGQMRVRERGGDQALGQQLRALMRDAIRGKPREAAGPRYQLVLLSSRAAGRWSSR
jgi:hypothetical protein